MAQSPPLRVPAQGFQAELKWTNLPLGEGELVHFTTQDPSLRHALDTVQEPETWDVGVGLTLHWRKDCYIGRRESPPNWCSSTFITAHLTSHT